MSSIIVILLLISIYIILLDALWFPRIRIPLFRKNRYNSSSSSLTKYDQYNGLKNLGNTCYINSILQGLYHIPMFRDIIITTKFADNSIGHSLQQIFQNLKEADSNTIDPKHLISKLGIDTRIQEDAQEFLLKLIDKLGESIDDNNNNDNNNDNNNKKGKKDNKIVNRILNGELINTIKCVNVDYTKERKQKFIDISVDIDGYNTLDESLHHLFEPIHLDGDNQYKAGDYGMQDAIKNSRIMSSPKLLFIHLKRFAFDLHSGNMRKISNKLDFPLVLNMTNYIIDNDKELKTEDKHLYNNNMYELKAIIIHEGNVNYGHYTCYAKVVDNKNKSKEKWIDLNDHSVTNVDVSNVMQNSYGGSSSLSTGFSKNAYILFYQKM